MNRLPRGFILPNGRACSVRCFVHSWKVLKSLPPNEDVKGWEWYSMPAHQILNAIRYGVHDRINQRGGVVVRELHPNRLHRLRRKHGLR